MPHYKYETQSMLENLNHKLYYDRSIMTDLTTHNNTLNIVILDKIIKEKYLIGAAMPNSHNFHSTNTEKLQKYKNLKEGLIRI